MLFENKCFSITRVNCTPGKGFYCTSIQNLGLPLLRGPKRFRQEGPNLLLGSCIKL